MELDLVDFCTQFAAQIIKANKTLGAFSTPVQQSMEKDILLMKHILTDACHHLRPHYESRELLFEEKEDRKIINFGNKTVLISVLNGVSNFVKIQIGICHNQEDSLWCTMQICMCGHNRT